MLIKMNHLRLSLKKEAENNTIEKLLPAKNFIYNSDEDLTYSHVCPLEDYQYIRPLPRLSCYSNVPLGKKIQVFHLSRNTKLEG